MRWRRRKKRSSGKPDYLFILALFLLVVFGLVMLASASLNLGKSKFDDSYYYIKHQTLYGVSVGVVGFFLGFFIYYRHYRRFAFLFLLGSIVLLVLVFTPLGVQAKGATRWLALGPLTFQPAEILKITLVLYLAAWLSRDAERQKNFRKGFLPFAAVLVVISLLLLKQPTTSAVALLMATAFIMYFISGARFRYIAGSLALGLLLIATVTVLTPYRWERVQNFFRQESNIQAGGFHLNQAKIAIGSGGLTGVGFGQSTTKLQYLPEPVGDSIFAIVAEELGFIGATTLIAVFAILVLRLFLLALRARDKFGKLILIGFGTIIALQTFIHIGAISGLLPLTGMTLPFVSYGSTALAVFMTMGGIAANVSKYA